MHQLSRLAHQLVQQLGIEAVGSWPQLQGCLHAEDDMPFAAVEFPFMPTAQNMAANALGDSETAILTHVRSVLRST